MARLARILRANVPEEEMTRPSASTQNGGEQFVPGHMLNRLHLRIEELLMDVQLSFNTLHVYVESGHRIGSQCCEQRSRGGRVPHQVGGCVQVEVLECSIVLYDA